MTTDPLRQLFDSADAVLFDFDGPICSVFDGYPAQRITAELRELAGTLPHDLDEALRKPAGPHELLLAAATDQRLATRLERALQEAEIKAVETARPTPGAAESLAACKSSGKLVAIVSNNYTEAVVRYLVRTGLADRVAHVEGRDPSDPTLMKPSPHLLDRATVALGIRTAACVFIGDQASDMEAGRAAGTRIIGYANKPGKSEALTHSGASAVVDSMFAIAAAIR
ncbi:HAD-superfamily hydrolase, subfamily IA, variant 3 [Kribbella flavida DSM 17836]|uniref:HAD-superfamily hydrolase, subfamily IA, variant 3 n=1 Tax=Kribbella flavida (strain DSM 17836 / JCM 10339 / NBRC 14399) TaxID=479435 RepID=D2PUI9_KRIFD|nr:HAD family hydrolase [Kribbella flavida]ADB29507.1 HAD-superfamily hydrolase, subfamily IA, variant 3 [Kribbella flavida DSM 17836]